ncbi:hypothetical protein [Pseudarthrobacter polychromogenes]|uniref:CobW/HypB/UreG nucleotide-binding domain-containing protein n=1 Tax=Pseudarthrobacter polychromogenes TaxID=1676 RepID=A0ABQ1XUN3_9MICC|nr:hypothetical protein [Pseudarthrobacter polychromogenes]GGH03278.1 hypothetical protein GCM10011577_29040 [Pseudarthrobacter polychromogenes]
MELIVVTSLDALCRQQACEDLAAARPGSLVVLHDLLENGIVVRRTSTGAGEIERGESFLEHGCLSCAVRLDLVPGIERLIQDSQGKGTPGPIIIGLAPATPAQAAVTALNGKLADRATVSSVILALAPDALEDHIWDSHTLFESGFTPMVEDERTPGECLIGELAFADTVLSTEPDIVPAHPAGRERGLHLVRQLAPTRTWRPAQVRSARDVTITWSRWPGRNPEQCPPGQGMGWAQNGPGAQKRAMLHRS